MRSILHVVSEHALKHPSKLVLRSVASDQSASEWTYGALWETILSVGTCLSSRVQAGERVLLSYASPFQFASTFLGCLLVGAIPVPCPPLRFKAAKRRAESIISSCTPVLVVGETRFLDGAACSLNGLECLDLFEEDVLATGQDLEPTAVDPNAIAFLQYTSGSTSEPRGVMVTHGNLQAMSEALNTFGGDQIGCNYFGALPLSHDMGIIGLLLQPLWLGGSSTIMQPEAFLKRPETALDCISRYHIDFAGGPPFFYKSMLDLPEERIVSIDLSSWKVAFVGAEPIPAKMLRQFSRRFAAFGFSSLVFAPCYGLAEATLLVTGVRPDVRFASIRLPNNQERCHCGARLAEGRILIVNRETGAPCLPNQTGEIWVQGPEVARGYWGQDDASTETFSATIDGFDGEWLRTGDLGRLDGETLIPEGRTKEIMIFDGLNFYPQDLESVVAQSHPEVRAVAIQPTAGKFSNQLVILIEVKRAEQSTLEMNDLGDLARSIDSATGLLPSFVGVVSQGKLPTTTSGKLQRVEACEQFTQEDYSFSAQWALRREDLEAQYVSDVSVETEAQILTLMQERVAHYLKQAVEAIDINSSLLDLGLDSSLSMQLIVDLEKVLKVRLPDAILVQNPSLKDAAKAVFKAVKN
ncbi:MAG: AMP-binding protein [Opitutaceae bacterium]